MSENLNQIRNIGAKVIFFTLFFVNVLIFANKYIILSKVSVNIPTPAMQNNFIKTIFAF